MNQYNQQLHWHCLTHTSNKKCAKECYLQSLFALFGKKHTLPIIRQLLIENKLRFNEIQEKVGGSPKTIIDRLRELGSHGLIHRETFNEIPIRVEYSLTNPGKDMERIFEMITLWIKTWLINGS